MSYGQYYGHWCQNQDGHKILYRNTTVARTTVLVFAKILTVAHVGEKHGASLREGKVASYVERSSGISYRCIYNMYVSIISACVYVHSHIYIYAHIFTHIFTHIYIRFSTLRVSWSCSSSSSSSSSPPHYLSSSASCFRLWASCMGPLPSLNGSEV